MGASPKIIRKRKCREILRQIKKELEKIKKKEMNQCTK